MQSKELKDNSILQFKGLANLYLNIITVLVLFVYILCYHPFITETYLLPSVRIAVETLLLLLLILASLTHSSIRIYFLWFIPIIMIHSCLLFMEFHSFVKLISFFNKIAFFILVIDLLTRDSKTLNLCLKLWIGLSYLLCIFAIISFIGYLTGIINFSQLQFSDNRLFLHNPVLGNIIQGQ